MDYAATTPAPQTRFSTNGHHDDEATLHKPDDDKIAIALAEDWKGKMAYFYSQWHEYQAGYWNTQQVQQVKQNVRHFIQRRVRGIPISLSRINSVTGIAELDCFISDKRIDQGMNYINLQNGLLNVETGALEPHDPDLFMTTQLDFEYNPEADCPTFRRYLNTSLVKEDGKTDHEMILLVQEMIGYCLTARTDLKAAFWLVGKRDSGKSTMVSFMRNLMGNLHATIDLNQLGTNRFLLSTIAGKRLITFTESNANSYLPDALFKALVGGEDEIYADVKNKTAIAFKPTAKMIWAMNDMPRVNDRSGAVFSRIHMIPFNRSVPEDERILGLVELLTKERAGVLNWALLGYKRLCRMGHFTQPAQSVAALDEYRLKNDTENTYVQERCDLNAGYAVPAADLIRDYRTWCVENGFQPKNANQLAGEWQRLGFYKTRANGKSVWHGLRLLPVE